jgi:hypothetical protein
MLTRRVATYGVNAVPVSVHSHDCDVELLVHT